MRWWYMDKFLFDCGLAASRTEAKRAIAAGSVEFNHVPVPRSCVYLFRDDENDKWYLYPCLS